nr:hypothetical protein KPFJINZV_KPFJINZV_CDS_0007 [Gokushovirinae sp.]
MLFNHLLHKAIIPLQSILFPLVNNNLTENQKQDTKGNGQTKKDNSTTHKSPHNLETK